MDDLNALLSQLSPEELEQLMGMGTLDERGGALQDQIAQAQALRNQPTAPHSTGIGAALSGLAGAVNTGLGAYREDKARGQQDELLQKKDKGRALYLEALRRQGMQPVAGSAGMGDLPTSSLFGFG